MSVFSTPPHHSDVPVEVGTRWAYRAKSIDQLVEVVVLRMGTKRPARVRVRWVDEDEEGREEWVPPARLKVPWSEVEAFRAWEARWAAINGVAVVDRTPEDFAAGEVFVLLIPRSLAEMETRTEGATRVRDVPGLAGLTGLSEHVIRGHASAFMEGADLIVPWPTTRSIVTRLAAQNAPRVLEYVRQQEISAIDEAINGDEFGTSAEGCYQVDLEFSQPIRRVLREWCGAPALTTQQQVDDLVKEGQRVREIAGRAIRQLHAVGQVKEAKKLERELGGAPSTSPQRPPLRRHTT